MWVSSPRSFQCEVFTRILTKTHVFTVRYGLAGLGSAKFCFCCCCGVLAKGGWHRDSQEAALHGEELPFLPHASTVCYGEGESGRGSEAELPV